MGTHRARIMEQLPIAQTNGIQVNLGDSSIVSEEARELALNITDLREYLTAEALGQQGACKLVVANVCFLMSSRSK